MKLKNLVIAIIIIFWPLNLILHISRAPNELLTYLAPAILLLISLKHYRCKNISYYIIPILLIPLISPKLALFPIIFFLGHILLENDKKQYVVATILGMILFTLSWSNYYGQTIFDLNYEARQKVIRDQQLYPTPLSARIFHNKARIIIDKANDGFFAITDPNNYFFGYAPRQIRANQNLQKFPFLALPFILYGLYKLGKLKEKNFVLTSLFAGIVSLSLLTIFDQNDFILWVPLSMMIIHGINQLDKTYPTQMKYYYWIFITFASIETARILI